MVAASKPVHDSFRFVWQAELATSNREFEEKEIEGKEIEGKKMKKQLVIKRLVTALAIGLFATGAVAMPSNPGVPVKKIPFASQINNWSIIDKATIVVTQSASKSYVVNLRGECHRLGFSDQVGFSSSNNTIYAGFDYVTVGPQRCAIQSINKISPAERKLLTKS